MTIDRRQFLVGTAAGVATVDSRLRRLWPEPQDPDIDALFDRSIVFDSLSLAHRWDDDEWAAVEASGYTAIQTSLSNRNLEVALDSLMAWRQRFEDQGRRYRLVTRAAQIAESKEDGRLGVVLGFQNATMIETDIDNLELLYALGTRNIQLTYNTRNLLGDGCTERTNSGLSDFGVAVVERMGELGIMVDLSHCGEQTSADGIRFASRPPAFTHTMCKALYEHPRAKNDTLLRAMADKGGVTGIAALGYFIGPNLGTETTFERYIDHIDHAVNVAGIEHVALCTDYQIRGIRAWATRESWYEPRLVSFKPSYKVQWPPWIPELDEPTRFRTVAHALARRRYRPDDIEKILGLNWVRCLRDNIG